MQFRKMQNLLLGSRAKTNSDGLLNSPAPETFMAVTLNSYSIPATTSFTANVRSRSKFRATVRVTQKCYEVEPISEEKADL